MSKTILNLLTMTLPTLSDVLVHNNETNLRYTADQSKLATKKLP